jgi:hypothetical protein
MLVRMRDHFEAVTTARDLKCELVGTREVLRHRRAESRLLLAMIKRRRTELRLFVATHPRPRHA